MAGSGTQASGGVRVLLLAAHPNDEFTIAATLRRHVAAGDEVFASFYLAEDRPGVAERRQAESRQGLALAGVRADHLEFVTLEPLPLPEQLPGLVSAMRSTLARVQPDVAYVPAFEGGHPDHDAVNFAAWETAGLGGVETFEFPLYTGAKRRFFGRLPAFMRFSNTSGAEREVRLKPEEVRFKRELWRVYRSQHPLFDVLLRASGDERSYFSLERIRPIPLRDWTKPPAERPLFYERVDMAYSFDRFAQAVRAFIWTGGIPDQPL